MLYLYAIFNRKQVIRLRLEQLFYFEVLVQENSFNKAAAKLHIAQPSLTANIKSLENEVNKTLLLRNAHGFSLTEDGKKVLAFSKTVHSLYQALQNDLNASDQPLVGEFAIVTPKFFSEIIMEQFVFQFQTKFPQIKVYLIENMFYTSPQHLASTSCKFSVISRLSTAQEKECAPGMLISDEEFFDNEYQYLPLFQDILGFCFSENSPLLNQSPVYPATLIQENYPFTSFPFQDCIITEQLLLSSNSVKLHIDAMKKSNAYCSLPYYAYKKLFSQEENIVFRSYSNNISITFYLIYPTNHILSPVEQLFIEELQCYLSKMNFN